MKIIMVPVRIWRVAAGAILVLALFTTVSAAAGPAGIEAAAALATIEQWQGTWSITNGNGLLAKQMVYDVGSRGSIVTEQFGKELSVFARDGERLIMTHYCNAGNQPRLQLKRYGDNGIFDFVMFDITGLANPHDAHVQEIIYRVIDPATIQLSLIWTGQGAGAVEAYTLRRLNRPH